MDYSDEIFEPNHLNTQNIIQENYYDSDQSNDSSERCFPFSTVLMCWFHVEFNVNKKINSKKVPETLEAMVKSDIKSLHYTLSEGEYTSQLAVVKARWGAYASLNDFREYFWSEWVDGRFNKWQIWNTPCPGVATTNSCIESFNKQVKFVYTGYELYSILQFIDICFDKIINHYSVQPKEFCYYRPPTYDMIVKANDILSSNLNALTSGGINIYWIASQSRSTSYRLGVEDHQYYPSFKFVYCTCIGICYIFFIFIFISKR